MKSMRRGTSQMKPWVMAIPILLGVLGTCLGLSDACYAERPNIVLVMLDDGGMWNLSSYHDLNYGAIPLRESVLRENRTPHIDALLNTGLRFTSAYTPGSMCWPTRGSLLTGLYPARWNSAAAFSHQYERLGTMLQKAGYYTMTVGKTHNGWKEGDFPPTQWGWDRYCATYTAHDYFSTYCYPGAGEREFTDYLGPSCSINQPGDVKALEVDPKTGKILQFGRITRKGWNSLADWRQDEKFGYRTVPGDWARRYAPILESNPDRVEGFEYVTDIGAYDVMDPHDQSQVKKGFLTEFFNQKAVQYVRDYAASESTAPFFLYVPHSSPHVPACLPPKDLLGADARASDFKSLHVRVVDRGIGALVQELKDLDLFDDTVLVVCSDNGGDKNSTPGLRGVKGSFHEGGIRTPLIISWPAGVPVELCRTDYPYPVSLMDLAATFRHLAGDADPTSGLDGVNLWPSIVAGRPVERTLFFGGASPDSAFATVHWEFEDDGKTPKHKWKYVRSSGGNTALFDLRSDPTESSPIRDTQTIRDCQEQLARWRNEMNQVTGDR